MSDFPIALTNAVDGPPGTGTEILAKHLNNLEVKVGIDTTGVTTSLDYLLKNAASIEPGHKHNFLWFPDGSAQALIVGATGNIGISHGVIISGGGFNVTSYVTSGSGAFFDYYGGQARFFNYDYGTAIYGFVNVNDSIYISGGTGLVGIGTIPTISDGRGLHIAGKILRLDTSKTPASAGATGNKGEVCWDSGFLYVCVDTNTWKKAAIASW